MYHTSASARHPGVSRSLTCQTDHDRRRYMSKNTFTLTITNVRTAIKCARRFQRSQENWRCLYRSIRVQQYMYTDVSTSVTSARRHNHHKSRVMSRICVVQVWVVSDVWTRMFENIIQTAMQHTLGQAT